MIDFLFECAFIGMILIVSPLIFASNVVEWYRLSPSDEDRPRCWYAIKVSSVGLLFWLVVIAKCLSVSK